MSIVTLIWMARKVPDRLAMKQAPSSSQTLGTTFRAVYQNKPLLLFVAAHSLSGLAMGMWIGLLFIYLDSYLLLGEGVAAFFVIGNLVSLASLAIWLRYTDVAGKVAAWIASTIVSAFCILISGLLEPGVDFWIPLILICGIYFANGCNHIVAPSMLADIVDYGKLRFKGDRAGSYFSFYTLLGKINAGVGGGAALAVAGIYSFNPALQAHSPQSIFGLKLAFAGVPVVLTLASVVFILMTPITKRRHEIIQKRINRSQAVGREG